MPLLACRDRTTLHMYVLQLRVVVVRGIGKTLIVVVGGVQAGRLYLIKPYLTFASLDRKSVRFSIPLCTIRRVERLNSRTGAFALSILLWHGLKLIIQLTSLRPTADLFCARLRDGLKEQLQSGQMKAMKAFVKTCYSETLVASGAYNVDHEREDGSLITPDSPEGSVHLGGLGLTYKFPGDPKK